MDIQKIRDLFPDYIRGKLSADQQESVRRALESDPKLAAECRELEKYYESLGPLLKLKAPVGFAQRVMRRIEAKQEKKSLASIIFRPFHTKLPLETAGLLATAVLLIVLFRPVEKMQQSLTQRSQPSRSMAPSAAATEQEEATDKPALNAADEMKDLETRQTAPHAEYAKAEKPAGKARVKSAEQTELAFASEKSMNKVARPEQKQPAGGAGLPMQFSEEMTGEASGASGLVRSEPKPAQPSAPQASYPSSPQASREPEPASAPAMDAEIALSEERASAKRERMTDAQASAKAAEEMMPEPIQLVLSVTGGTRDESVQDKLKKNLVQEKAKSDRSEKDEIEKAIKACGARITKHENNRPQKGQTRYEMEIPASSYDSLASALSKFGRLDVKSERPAGISHHRVKVILVIEGL